MKKQCITNPEEVKWATFWREKIKTKKDAKKDWNKASATFHIRAKRDDYHTLLLSKLIIDKNDSVLDLGCGEGSITLEIAKKAKKVTALDSAEKMLELLEKNAQKEGITNITTVLNDIENISYEELGSHDVVIASRSLNTIEPIEDTLKTIDKIANKYVFITFFGPLNSKIEEEAYEYIGKEHIKFPNYNYLFNILFNLGIYPNTERLDIKKYRQYKSIDDAIKNGKFRPELLNEKQLEKLREYIEKTFKKDEKTGMIYNKTDKADWVLFWWKKS